MQGRSVERDRVEDVSSDSELVAEFPPSFGLWEPSDGQSRDDWMLCHGQSCDVWQRTKGKLNALKGKLIAAHEQQHHNQTPAARAAATANQSVGHSFIS